MSLEWRKEDQKNHIWHQEICMIWHNGILFMGYDRNPWKCRTCKNIVFLSWILCVFLHDLGDFAETVKVSESCPRLNKKWFKKTPKPYESDNIELQLQNLQGVEFGGLEIEVCFS